MPVHRHSWTTAPEPVERARPIPPWAVDAAAAYTVALGPIVRALVMPSVSLGSVVLAVAVGFVATRILGEERWWARLAVAAGAGGLLVVSQGGLVGVWMAMSLLAADWGVRGWRPVQVGHRPGTDLRLATVLLATLAAWRGADTAAVLAPLIVLAAALVLLCVSALVGDRFEQTVKGVATRIGTAVSVALFAALALLIVVLPWGIHRLTGVDELDPFSPGRSSWLRRDRLRGRPARLWAPDGVLERPRLAPRVRQGLLAVTLLALAWVAVGPPDLGLMRTPSGGSLDRPGRWWTEPNGIPAAYRDAPWYPEYRRDIEWVMDQDAAFRPLHPLRVLDATTRYVNVHHGERVTWSPPCGSCTRLTVWVYGGSTTFGIGQRDAFTVPSQLAKVAWDAGMALDVVNRGTPGDLHWEEAQRLAWDLGADEGPDLVVFYDGANELWSARTLDEAQAPDDTGPNAPLLDQFWDGVEELRGTDVPAGPDGAALLPVTTVPRRTPTEIGQLAATRYRRSLAMSEASAASVPIRWFWQPVAAYRPPVPPEPSNIAGDPSERVSYAAARAMLPGTVTDLSDLFDDVRVPLFSDAVHHNERGARVVAEAIFAEIRPDLERLGSRP